MPMRSRPGATGWTAFHDENESCRNYTPHREAKTWRTFWYARFCGRKGLHGEGVDQRGLPKTVLVEAHSLFEAAAEGLERLHREGGCRFEALEVTVHEPRGNFQVRPGQLVHWLGQRSDGETIGVTALKRRVQELLRGLEASTAGSRRERRR